MDDAEARARALLGTVLNDKWTLEGLLGVGGMAAVFSARHRNGARAAVKLLDLQLARVEEVRVRFLREGYAANRVEHPGAVKVLDDDVVTSGPAEGSAYIVMELLEGESLEARTQRGEPVGEREFLLIADAILDVLEAAHARGVVHRDLKPENLFLVKRAADRDPNDDTPRVKVLDFGLARLLENTSQTGHGLALGTPSFMSPEQAAGRIAEIDGRTDLFALAATGFRLLTDRRIHEGSNPVQIVTKMAQIPAPRVRDVAPYVSDRVAAILDRGLEFRREDRYPDATSMRADVKAVLLAMEATAPTLLVGLAPESARGAAPSREPAPPKEPTLELSATDLEVAAQPPASPRASPPPPSLPPPLPTTESAPRRRPSFIPLLAVLLFAAIATKLAVDAQRAPAVAPSASASASGSTAPPAASSSHDAQAASVTGSAFEEAAAAPPGVDGDASARDAPAVDDADTTDAASLAPIDTDDDASTDGASSRPASTARPPSKPHHRPGHPRPHRRPGH